MNTKLGVEHSEVDSTAFKPVEHIQKVIDEVSPFAQNIQAFKGEILRFSVQGKACCYLLHSGSVTLNRRGDGIVISSEQTPAVFGMNSFIPKDDSVYLRVVENSRLSRLSLERFDLVIKSCGLWEQLCKTLIYNTSRVFEHCSRIAQLSASELIQLQLKELMQESERVRNSITASNYIRSRTYLSRSNIMRILAELRDDGLITLNRGILLSIHF